MSPHFILPAQVLMEISPHSMSTPGSSQEIRRVKCYSVDPGGQPRAKVWNQRR